MSYPLPLADGRPTVKLVLASRDLELGTILREGDVVFKDWPGEVPTGAASHTQAVVGRGVVTKIYAKEPILEARLAPKGAGGAFAATIPRGMRAVAVPVNEVVGLAGFAAPGMHVDVLISGTPQSGTAGQGTQTKTLLQNIEVLSAAQDFKKLESKSDLQKRGEASPDDADAFALTFARPVAPPDTQPKTKSPESRHSGAEWMR